MLRGNVSAESRGSRVISSRTPLLLGSASPRRRELLEQLGIPLRVLPPTVDEAVREGEAAPEYLARIVDAKLSAVRQSSPRPEAAVILCADTSVIVDGEILGKPDNDDHAMGMLQRLCGREHEVMTRYAFGSPETAETLAARLVVTQVRMRDAAEAELRRYVATGEGRDKAGSYAAQGIGAFLVESLAGSYSNVVGLPQCEVVADLLRLGLLQEFP